jgi:chemotaxis response regulator CheB
LAVSNTVKGNLKGKAKKKDIPVSILVDVYERGQAAWLTGSRPGIGMAQWAMARVNSFVRAMSSGPKKHDKDLHEKVKEYRRKQRKRRMGSK